MGRFGFRCLGIILGSSEGTRRLMEWLLEEQLSVGGGINIRFSWGNRFEPFRWDGTVWFVLWYKHCNVRCKYCEYEEGVNYVFAKM